MHNLPFFVYCNDDNAIISFRYFLFISSLFSNNSINAQTVDFGKETIQRGEVINIFGRVKHADTKEYLNDVYIFLECDGEVKQVNSISGNKAFDFKVGYGKIYKIIISKVGYVSKLVEINTNIPDNALKNGQAIDLDLSLNQSIISLNLGGEINVFTVPIAKASFDEETKDVSFDFDYVKLIREKAILYLTR